jgi:hypothetical protein
MSVSTNTESRVVEQDTYNISQEAQMLQSEILAAVQLIPLITLMTADGGTPERGWTAPGRVHATGGSRRAGEEGECICPASTIFFTARKRSMLGQFKTDPGLVAEIAHCEERQGVYFSDRSIVAAAVNGS